MHGKRTRQFLIEEYAGFQDAAPYGDLDMNQPPSRLMIISYYLIILLLLLTPILLIWQHFGMTRTIELSGRQPHGVMVADDRDEQGTSVSSLVQTSDALVMRCTLRAVYAWPFC